MSKLFIKNQLLNKHKSNLSESSIIHLNKICEKFNITNAKLYYEGFHNITYKVLINDSWYQLKIPIDFTVVNRKIEEKIYKHSKESIYYKNGFLIKKWFDGKDLNKVNLTNKIQIKVLEKLKEFSKLKIKTENFDWNLYKTNNKKYLSLVDKYKNEKLVLQHGDLSFKNILVNKNFEVNFIDYELVRNNYLSFDLFYLHKNGFSKENILKVFNITEKYLKDIFYISSHFDYLSYKHEYSKKYLTYIKNKNKVIQDNFLPNLYALNDKKVKLKSQSFKGLNLKSNYQKFNKFDLFVNVSYEDNKMIIFENLNEINHLQFNASSFIKNFQSLKIKPKKYFLKLIVEKLFLKHKEKLLNYLDLKLMLKIIKDFKSVDADTLSHNKLFYFSLIETNNKKAKLQFNELLSKNNKYFDIATYISSLNLSKNKEINLLKEFDKNLNLDEYYKIKVLANFYLLLIYIDENILNFDLNIFVKNITKYKKSK
ncbi:hypothetical protein [Mycoplasmopsis synoviae]|uniref:hypothetical protein n=1 Tax=Mycoplasmopsis synoviae TaxID=2109 RepID=UPI001CE1DEB8|nr:hypothetical protein [Mycoplasmopsis synoviae]UBX97888.1 hypothetical protein K6987_02305 [Mycoplasmopsis synoviae]